MNINKIYDLYKKYEEVYIHKNKQDIKCFNNLCILFSNYLSNINNIEINTLEFKKKLNYIISLSIYLYRPPNNITYTIIYNLHRLNIEYTYIKNMKKKDIKKIDKFDTDNIIKIFKNIKKIEGPISYYLLKPTKKLNDILGRDGPVMILFGDIHNGNQRCITGCDTNKECYTFYNDPTPSIIKLINEIGEKIRVDFFTEFWKTKNEPYILKQKTNTKLKINNKNISSMLDIIVTLEKCIDDNKCKDDINFYVHMSDPRYTKLEYSIDGIFKTIPKLTYEEFKQILYQKDIDINEMLNILYDRLTLGYKKFIENYFYKENNIISKHSKIYKQLIKLPKDIKKYIFENYESKYRAEPLYMINKILYNNIKSEEKYEMIKRYIKEFKIKSLIGTTEDVDLYFIGRSLKILKDKDYSRLTIGYFGEAHIINIKNFLINNGLYTLENKYKQINKKCLKNFL